MCQSLVIPLPTLWGIEAIAVNTAMSVPKKLLDSWWRKIF